MVQHDSQLCLPHQERLSLETPAEVSSNNILEVSTSIERFKFPTNTRTIPCSAQAGDHQNVRENCVIFESSMAAHIAQNAGRAFWGLLSLSQEPVQEAFSSRAYVGTIYDLKSSRQDWQICSSNRRCHTYLQRDVRRLSRM
jgi:hypothetical protein